MRRRRGSRTDAAGPATRWPRRSSLLALALAFLLGLSSFGTYVNDEAAQLEGVHNLRHGSLGLDHRAPQFFAILEGVFLPGVNDTAGPNHVVSALAMPTYGALWAVSWVVSPANLLLLGWTAAAYATATRGWARLHEARGGQPWSWYTRTPPANGGLRSMLTRLRTMTPAHWTVVGAIALWSLSQWTQTERIDYGTWGETFAVQTTHILLSAVAFVLFFDLLRRETNSPRATWLASGALLLGPFAAWGVGIKYHAPSMALAVATLWAYQRDDRWRYAAFALATLGAALTPLGAPTLGALVLVEMARGLRSLRDGAADGRARLVRAGAAVGAVAAFLLLFWEVTPGAWLGVFSTTNESLWDAILHRLRYEGPGQSLSNLWGAFVDGRRIEGAPVSILALSPLAALALLAPARLRGRWTRSLAAAATGALLFLVLFIHAAHTQGDGRDVRFFTAVLPHLLLLGAAVAAPRLDAVAVQRWRPARCYALLAGAVVLLLFLLGAANVALVAGAGWRQLLQATWLLGTVAWVALASLDLLQGPLARRWGAAAMERAWAWAAAASLVPGSVWLFHVLVFTNRVIPPWPFSSGAAGMSFLMPSLDAVRTWWLDALVPV